MTNFQPILNVHNIFKINRIQVSRSSLIKFHFISWIYSTLNFFHSPWPWEHSQGQIADHKNIRFIKKRDLRTITSWYKKRNKAFWQGQATIRSSINLFWSCCHLTLIINQLFFLCYYLSWPVHSFHGDWDYAKKEKL